MTLSQNQNKFRIIFAVAASLVLILLVILIISFITGGKKQEELPEAQPSITTQKLIPPTKGREPQPLDVQKIKNQLIENPIEDKGDKILEITDNFRIVYVPTPDIFFVQITKDPAQGAKVQAQDWFVQKGLAQGDLCNLPVRFLLFNASLKKTNPNFNPLPDGC